MRTSHMSSPNEGRIDPEKRRSTNFSSSHFASKARLYIPGMLIRHQPSDGRDHERRDIVRKSVWDKRTGKAKILYFAFLLGNMPAGRILGT
jgi:hypothetical protein